MQKAVIVKDAESLAELNTVLEEGELYVEHVSPNPNGSWLVILEAEEGLFDYEMEEEELTEEE